MMKGGIMYEQGEIVLIPFPYSDLTGSKLRPALIMSNSLMKSNSDKVCCFITSKPSKDGILISKGDFSEGRLPFKSWIKPYRIFTINEEIIKKKLCKVKPNFYSLIFEEMCKFLKWGNKESHP